MPQKAACATTLIALLIVLLDGSFVSAETLVVSDTDRGSYTEMGFSQQSERSYIVGDPRGTCASVIACPVDGRNFFVFDLSSISQAIESARLALFVPGPVLPGYKSPDPSENYESHDVVTPLSTLLNGTGGVAAWNDLGTGVVYGSRTMTAADNGTIVEITLNSSAINALNAALGRLFALGGSLITLDTIPNDEYTFRFATDLDITQLRLTLVPEPSTLILLATAAIGLFTRKPRPSQKCVRLFWIGFTSISTQQTMPINSINTDCHSALAPGDSLLLAGSFAGSHRWTNSNPCRSISGGHEFP